MCVGDRGRTQNGLHSSVNIDASHRTWINLLFSDIKPDNILIDKDGHIKLSDFGLSTGFHKQHDSAYYQRLLDSANGTQQASAPSRNSVMVNPIHLTMTSKDQIATWKANRRKLVCIYRQIWP
jgi:protein-serine/threonine kinase